MRPLPAIWKNQSEMQKQRRCQQGCRYIRAIYFVVERIQFSAVVERAENKRHQAKNRKMNCEWSVPPLPTNEESDESIQQPGKYQIIINRFSFTSARRP